MASLAHNPVSDDQERTRLRLQQDFLIMLLANQNTDERLRLTEGGPTIKELRSFVYPQWESVVRQHIREYAEKQGISVPNFEILAERHKNPKESDIVYESGDYWVLKSKGGFKVFKTGVTHSQGMYAVPTLEQAKDLIQAHQNSDARKGKRNPLSTAPFLVHIGNHTSDSFYDRKQALSYGLREVAVMMAAGFEIEDGQGARVAYGRDGRVLTAMAHNPEQNPGPYSIINYKGGKGGHSVATSADANMVRQYLRKHEGNLDNLTVWHAGKETYPGIGARDWLEYNNYLRSGKKSGIFLSEQNPANPGAWYDPEFKSFYEIGYYEKLDKPDGDKNYKFHRVESVYNLATDAEAYDRAQEVAQQLGHAVVLTGRGSPYDVPMKRKRSNPAPQSAALFESFHGTPSTTEEILVEEERYHGNLAELGVLVSLTVETVAGDEVKLGFESGYEDEDEAGNPKVELRDHPLNNDPQAVLVYSHSAGPGIYRTSKGYVVALGGGQALSGTFRTLEAARRAQEKAIGKRNPKGPFGRASQFAESALDSAQSLLTQRGPIGAAYKAGKRVGEYLDGRLGRVMSNPAGPFHSGQTVTHNRQEYVIEGEGTPTPVPYNETYTNWTYYSKTPKGRVGKAVHAQVNNKTGKVVVYAVTPLRGFAKNPGHDKETLIYGLAKGDTERYMEQLLYGGGRLLSTADIEKIKAAAARDGWHSFRVTAYDGSAPDFSKTIGNPHHSAPGPVLLCANESGTQLYFMGGDQSLDLSQLKIPSRDLAEIGQVTQIEYHTKKYWDGTGKKPEIATYYHKFGEEVKSKRDRPLPVLIYDALNEKLSLAGGDYRIEQPLIGLSPGLQN